MFLTLSREIYIAKFIISYFQWTILFMYLYYYKKFSNNSPTFTNLKLTNHWKQLLLVYQNPFENCNDFHQQVLRNYHWRSQVCCEDPGEDHNWLLIHWKNFWIHHQQVQVCHPDAQTCHPDAQICHPDGQACHWEVQTDHWEVQTDHWEVQTDHWEVQTDHWEVQTDHWEVQTDHWEVQTYHWEVQTYHWEVQTYHWEVQTYFQQVHQIFHFLFLAYHHFVQTFPEICYLLKTCQNCSLLNRDAHDFLLGHEEHRSYLKEQQKVMKIQRYQA